MLNEAQDSLCTHVPLSSFVNLPGISADGVAILSREPSGNGMICTILPNVQDHDFLGRFLASLIEELVRQEYGWQMGVDLEWPEDEPIVLSFTGKLQAGADILICHTEEPGSFVIKQECPGVGKTFEPFVALIVEPTPDTLPLIPQLPLAHG